MSDDPKPKPEQRVPSFDELKAPKRPAAPPSAELGQEEKTSQIDPDVLRKALAQSQVGAPIEPLTKPTPVALAASGKLPLQPMPARHAPPPPGSKPETWEEQTASEGSSRPGRGVRTDPETSPVATTTPALPVIKPQAAVPVAIAGRAPPPPPGSKPLPPPGARQVTEKMEPVTPDMIHASREKQRAQAPVQAAAQATPKPDPSLHQTHVSLPHRGQKLPEPSQSSPTLMEVAGEHTDPHAVPQQQVTQPNVENPFVSKRAFEPSSGDRPAAPPPIGDRDEPPTRNERPSSRPNLQHDIEADIVSEVMKLNVAEAPTHPGAAGEAASGAAVHAVEVLAHPAPTLRLLAAFLVDGLVLSLLGLGLGFVVMVAGKAPSLPPGLGLLDQLALRVNEVPKLVAATAVLAIGLGAAYCTLFSVALSGRTLGRLVAGLHLVDRSGAPPSALRALARSLVAIVSLALGGLGFWQGLFSVKSQTLHDKLCSTFVVRLGPSRT